VRLGSGLATAAGTRRLRVELPREATVATLIDRLRDTEPAIAPGLDSALPVLKGTHASGADPLTEGDEVALLLPVAGGGDAGQAGRTCFQRKSKRRRTSWP
jgi:molybdopterin converting factor small subunit